ncbi:MAG TPA: phosphate/phosphite/phosphonate ABC transporter substrate-binding protein, partial [bacterium]|nr:phosphate/phosphite/phosphonate ABC transporter substrate-binding protein [bacterium]
SDIREWSDLRGRSFGFVDPATTAGHLFPLIWLREHGVTDPESFFGSVAFTGSHDLLFLKVFNGELDAGAGKDVMLDQVAEARPEVRDGLRRIAVSSSVPNNVFVLGGDLDFPCFGCHDLVPQRSSPGLGDPPRRLTELSAILGDILLDLDETERGRAVLDALGADRFVATTAEDLGEVNRMIRQAGFDPATYRP